MAAVRNLKSVHPFIWVPPSTAAQYKVTVERADGTVDDITEDIVSVTVEDYCTESIGKFSFEIHNANNEYTTVWVGNEVFRYYKDYAATATTLRFRGRLEKVSKVGHYIKADGRGESLKFFTVPVTESYTVTSCSSILSNLVTNYASGFTGTNITSSATNITVNWYEKPFWDCVKDLCTASGFDCYVDANLDFHFFLSGSVKNANEAIVHGMNLWSIDDFTPDVAEVRNRIIVYGAQQEGIQLIHTANDTTSQTLYGVREEVITDDNMTNQTQIEEYAAWVLEAKKDPPIIGAITSILLLASIQPGDAIKCSSPYDGIVPTDYFSTGYKDSIGQDMITTEVYLNKEPRKISTIMRDRIVNENKTSGASINPEMMRFAYNFLYNTGELGTYTNSAIANGVLYFTLANGNWISPIKTEGSNVTECYVVINGQNLTDITVEISGNSGSSYQTNVLGSKLTLSSALGPNLVVKVTSSSTLPQIDSLSVQYNVA